MFHKEVYYCFGESYRNKTEPSQLQTGGHCYSSTDLYNWKDEGVVLARVKEPKSDITQGSIIERPKLIYNPKTENFVMWFHLELRGQGYNSARCGVAVADRPTGPYIYLRSERPDAGAWPVNVTAEEKAALPEIERLKATASLGATAGNVQKIPCDKLFLRAFNGGQMAKVPLLILLSFALLTQVVAKAATPIECTVTVDTNAAGLTVPSDFQGLSFEEPTITPRHDGSYYFSSRNVPLVRLLRLLGVKSLRFGGTTVDGPDYHISHTDIDNLFTFAKAVDAKVIYSFRLRTYPGEDKQMLYEAEALDARYIMGKYADQLTCFCLGNEPNVYYSGFKSFVPDWLQLSSAIISAAPEARFCGPGSWNSTEESWVIPFAELFGRQKNIVFINEHIYQSQASKFRPKFGSSDQESARQEGLARAEMLAKSDYSTYFNRLVPALRNLGVKYRIEETNSFSGGGVLNASDAYSASLWGLNYQWWWASHGASGLNFHTGAHNVNSGRFASYSVFSSALDGTLTPLGLSYAMLCFKLGSQGQVLNTTLSKSAANLNTTAYSILGRDGAVYVTLINQEWADKGRSASVTIRLPSMAIASIQMMSLAQTTGDVGFTPGIIESGSITLGGSSIQSDGTWTERWSASSAPTEPHTCRVIVPAASALLVRISSSVP